MAFGLDDLALPGLGVVTAIPKIIASITQGQKARSLRVQDTTPPAFTEKMQLDRQAAGTGRLPGLSSQQTRLGAGIYQFRLTVTDNAGGTATDDVIVTVNPAQTTPSFSETLAGEGNGTYPQYADTLTWSAAPATLLKYNNPVQATASTPGANTMLVFYPAGTQVAQLNYDPLDEGHACAVVLGGTTYYKNAATGQNLTFTNGSVTLGN